MQLKTILNRVARHKSFVYGEPRWVDDALRPTIEVPIDPRANGRPICSGCRKPRPGYDRLHERRFEFVPLWQIAVVFVYALRRVDCPTLRRGRGAGSLGERQEPSDDDLSMVPGRLGAAALLAGSGQRCSTPPGNTSATRCGTPSAGAWCTAICRASTAIGVDEIQWRRGHHYLTLVYQIDAGCRRLLWIGRERTEDCLRRGLELLGETFCSGLRFVCSDLWQPYLKVLAEQAGGAIHVLDRFHIMKQLGQAIDEVRAGEARRMKQDGYEPVLKHSRWCLLKRPENLTDQQTVKLAELLKYNLQSVRAYLHREDFQRFWEYQSPGWAGKFLDEWCTRVMRSRLEPLKKVARSLRKHRPLLAQLVPRQRHDFRRHR